MAIAAPPRLLGEILVQEGLTTPDVIDRALARAQGTRERIGEALVALGAVTTDDVLRALAQQQNLAYVSRDELPSPLPILKNLSPKYLRRTRCAPWRLGALITVAMDEPPIDDHRDRAAVHGLR